MYQQQNNKYTNKDNNNIIMETKKSNKVFEIFEQTELLTTRINNILNDYRIPDMPIVVYGKNCADMSVEKKREQLLGFGLKDVFIYYGGLFEWLLLNELYGDEEFPLQGNKCGNHADILKYRPPNK